MTKEEREQFNKCWLEAENLITVIDPRFDPVVRLKRPEQAGPKDLLDLMGFLRILVKVTLHDNESRQRECQTLRNVMNEVNNGNV